MPQQFQVVADTADDGQMLLVEQRGRFLCRRFVSNEYLAERDIIARRVQEDISAFGRYVGRQPLRQYQTPALELKDVHDPFETFHDPSDFPVLYTR